MTPREHIARLEGLLERIARNAGRPRARRAAPTLTSAVAPTPVTLPGPSRPSAPDSAPDMAAVQVVESAAIGRASDAPPPSSVPTARPQAAQPDFSAGPPTAAEPPFSAPPFSAPPFAAPLPVASARSGVSSVPPWGPEPGSTVQASHSSMPPEELSEDDLVEVTTVPPPDVPSFSAAASPSVPEDEIEEPPASSSRSKVAESLDQAIANAAARPDELEVPIHTPPPESGPQEAVLPAGIEAPRAAEFDDASGLVSSPALGPTPEQLGGTIELEGADGPEIEIEVAGVTEPQPVPVRPADELEVSLPRAEMPSGTYDVSATEEAPIASSLPTTRGSEPPPEILMRPAIENAEITHVIRMSARAPENFAALLDGALEL